MSTPLQGGIAQELVLVVSAPMNANFTSIAQDIRFFQLGSMQVIWSGNNSSTGVFRPQVSVDQTYWCDILPSTDWITSSTSDTCGFYAFDIVPFPYMRLYYDKGSNSAGTFSVKTFFKKMTT